MSSSNYQSNPGGKPKADPEEEKKQAFPWEQVFRWIFYTVIVIHIGISGYAFLNGNPSQLVQPYDSDHRACGVGDLADYPYIYFTAPTDKTLWKTVCVKQCPDKDMKLGELPCAPTKATPTCKAMISPTDATKRTLIYESHLFQGVICLPEAIKYYQTIAPTLDIEGITKIAGDIDKSKFVILGSLLLCIVLLFLYIWIQVKKKQLIPTEYKSKIFQGQVACNFLIVLALGVFCLLSATKELKSIEITDDQIYVQDPEQLKEIQESKTHDPTFYWIALGVCVVFLVYYVWSLSGTLFNEQKRKKFFEDVNSISDIAYNFFLDDQIDIEKLPILQVIFSFLYLGFWLYTALELYSCGEIVHEEKSLPFGQFKMSEATKYLAILHFFCLIWIMTFIVNLGNFFLIESADAFYKGFKVNSDKKQPFFELGTWWQATSSNYHIGSLALMSLLQFTVGYLKYIPFLQDFSFFQEIKKVRKETLYYLMKSNQALYVQNLNFKKEGNENSAPAEKDLEKNKKNNTENSESFKSFFEAGQIFLDLLEQKGQTNQSQQNPSGQIQVEQTQPFKESYEKCEQYGDFIQFNVSLWVSLIVTFSSYWLLKSNEGIHSPIISLVLIFGFSLTISNLFMSVIGASSDQFLLSYYDEVQNNWKNISPETYIEKLREKYTEIESKISNTVGKKQSQK